jgi:hypothetical protein
MSDPVEDELRALLQGRASTVGDARDPVAAVNAGVRRVVVRRRLAVTAGVPVLVGAVVGGAGLLSGQPQHDLSGAVAAATPSASAVTAPPTAPAPVLTSGPAGGPPPSSVPSAVPSSAVQSPAPTSAAVTTAGVTTAAADPQVEVYRAYLETDPMPRELAIVSAGHGGRPYCALRVLDRTATHAYLWVFCQEYYLKSGILTAGSVDSVPVRLTITGVGAGTQVLAAATPHSGSVEQADLKALFTPLAFTRSRAYSEGLLRSQGVDESAAELKVRAIMDAQSGRLAKGPNAVAP